MDLGLPAQFTRRLNLLDGALVDYQASYKEDDKREKMARVFILSCEMMNSLEVSKLAEDILKVLGTSSDGRGPSLAKGAAIR